MPSNYILEKKSVNMHNINFFWQEGINLNLFEKNKNIYNCESSVLFGGTQQNRMSHGKLNMQSYAGCCKCCSLGKHHWEGVRGVDTEGNGSYVQFCNTSWVICFAPDNPFEPEKDKWQPSYFSVLGSVQFTPLTPKTTVVLTTEGDKPHLKSSLLTDFLRRLSRTPA